METNGKIALVIGATGGIGGTVAETLLARGWQVRALARDPAGAASGWRGSTAPLWIGGDAMRREDVVRAARGVHAIVHAVNPPGYRGWAESVLPMIDNSIAAAEATGARVVLPGTLYNFDAEATPVVREDSPQHPPSRKGVIRAEMERRLEASGAPVLIVRAGDFFGPHSRASWFGQAMVKPGVRLRRIVYPGRTGVGHSWAYLPDLAEAIVRLMDMEDRLRRFERVQFEGHWDGDGRAMVEAVYRAVGRPSLPAKRFPWWLMRLLAPFGGFPREVMEVRPYWQAPVRLDNSRLVALLGVEPRTPLGSAVAETLRALNVS